MRRIVGILICVLFAAACAKKESIVIGSKNYSEQVLLGELLAQQIERVAGVKVERKLNLGGTFICHEALLAGKIDAYVEYTGTAFTAILKQDPKTNPEEVFQETRRLYEEKWHLKWMDPLGFNNTFA